MSAEEEEDDHATPSKCVTNNSNMTNNVLEMSTEEEEEDHATSTKVVTKYKISKIEELNHEIEILRREQRQDRTYQHGMNTLFEKLHNKSHEIYTDFKDSIDSIKVQIIFR